MMTFPTTGPSGATVDTVRVALLRWLDVSEAFRTAGDKRRRSMASHAAVVGSFLATELGWLRDRPGAGTDDDRRVHALQRQIAAALAVGEAADAGDDPEDDDATMRADLNDFVEALIEATFGPVADADADRLEAFATLLSTLAARTTALGAAHTDDDARAVARRAVAAELLRFWNAA